MKDSCGLEVSFDFLVKVDPKSYDEVYILFDTYVALPPCRFLYKQKDRQIDKPTNFKKEAPAVIGHFDLFLRLFYCMV